MKEWHTPTWSKSNPGYFPQANFQLELILSLFQVKKIQIFTFKRIFKRNRSNNECCQEPFFATL